MNDLSAALRSVYDVAQSAVHEGALPNGASFALWPDPRDTVVSAQIWVRVGSSYERPGKTGLAHMLEHLMFRGTTRFPDGQFDRLMESLGALNNACTWLDYTAYTSVFQPSALETILDVEADRFSGLLLTEDVFQAERSVVANERRQMVEADPDHRLHEELYRRAFGESAYAHPTIGWSPDIADYQLKDVQEFHERYYAPANLCVVLCGHFQTDQALDALHNTFGRLASRSTPHLTRHVSAQAGFHHAERLTVNAPRAVLAWSSPGITDPEYPVWAMLNRILGGSESSRLPVRLEMDDHSVLDVTTMLSPHALTGLFEIFATVRDGVPIERVFDAVREEIDRVATHGLSPDEIDTVTMQLRTSDAIGLASTSSRADTMGESWVAFGDTTSHFQLTERITQVSADDISALASRLASDVPCYTLVGVPESHS